VGSFLQIAAIAKAEIGPISPIGPNFALTISRPAAYPISRVMSLSLYRYYYYYGPLSTGRDGQAMGCRRALTM
jgi:hypothetical protein